MASWKHNVAAATVSVFLIVGMLAAPAGAVDPPPRTVSVVATAPASVTVQQGQTASFAISLTGGGTFPCDYDGQAWAAYYSEFQVRPNGDVWESDLANVDFFADANCMTTWEGAPDPATIAATVSAACDTPPATYEHDISGTVNGPPMIGVDRIPIDFVVEEANCPPEAEPDAYSVAEDGTLQVVAPGVLENDTDGDGDPVSVASYTQPASGSLTLDADGSFSYSPGAGFSGQDAFTYTISDGKGGSDTGTVTIDVIFVNDAPSFSKGPDQTVAEDSGPHSVPDWATDISAGPTSESGQTVSFTVTNDTPALFSVQPAISPNGTLTFMPAPNANGSASVTAVLKDDGGTASGGVDTSASQSFTIAVTPANDAPTCSGQSLTVDEGSTVNLALSCVDIDGDALSYSVMGAPQHGVVVLQTQTGAATYTPVAAYAGPDSFTFRASDGQADSQTETVSITVRPRTWDFGTFLSPLSKQVLRKSISAIPVKFTLQLDAATSASLATDQRIRAALYQGSAVTPIRSGLCSWDATNLIFQCSIKTPKGLTGSPYFIQAEVKSGAQWYKAVGAANPVQIAFK